MSRHRSKNHPPNRHKSTDIRSTNAAAISQVRIIGGRFKRQQIPFVQADGLRPTPDRLRETLFNWIQFDLNDARVLDVCAGSGVLGFEALSRGAAHVDFVEIQPKQVDLLKQSAQKLSLPENTYHIYLGDVLTVLPTISLPSSNVLLSEHEVNYNEPTSALAFDTPSYHLVFIDPPYDLDLWLPILNLLIKCNLISTKTLLYIEDKRPIYTTLESFNFGYTVLSETKMGQIYASLIKLTLEAQS